jgi:hypothetical protein
MKTATIHTTTGSAIYYSQRCLLCDNTRRLPEGMTYCTSPWVCDECKEAMAFVKELKHKQENFDPLEPVLD